MKGNRNVHESLVRKSHERYNLEDLRSDEKMIPKRILEILSEIELTGFFLI
jgi:hypothetical protein